MKVEGLQLPAKYPVLGLGISEVTFDNTINLLLAAAATGEKVRINFCTVNNLVVASRDSDLLTQMAESQVLAPDGMPLVWVGKLLGRRVERVCGPDLMPALCQRSREFGFRHFFYGGAEGVVGRLADRLQQRFPGLQVAGTYTPPFRPLTEEEDEGIIAQINRAEPHFVWVGLGTPKQDAWIAAHQARLQAPVLLAVGAAFDFHSGMVRRAPRWMQRSGLEWVFRLMSDPRRLWRRYLIGNTLFFLYLLKEVLRSSLQRAWQTVRVDSTLR